MKRRNKWCLLLLSAVLALGWTAPASALVWEAVPFVTEKQLDKGLVGGEHSQWVQAIAIDAQDGKFLLMGTDVGGMLRSTDGGVTWEHTNVGLTARGATGAAIDPRNPNRAIIVGANDPFHPDNGLYLTTDQAQSWKSVLKVNMSGYRDVREQIAFDESSYDAALGYTTVAYWLRLGGEDRNGGPTDPGLYKTTDGGETWSRILDTDAYPKGILKVHPTKGYVYIAGSDGIYKSVDGGLTFEKKIAPPEGSRITGMDVVRTHPDHVFFNLNSGGIYISSDAAETFSRVDTKKFPPTGDLTRYPGHTALHVSPVNIDRMVMMIIDGDWKGDKYYTEDGGVTWHKGEHDNLDSFMPYNGRGDNIFAWHPKDETVVWSNGGDYVTKSTDGGKHFEWANDGNNGVMTGGIFNFNVRNPDLMFVGSQDYAGAFSRDGGITWTYANVQDFEWGGWTYGTYAASPKVLIGGSPHWETGMKKTLYVSYDGGETFVNYRDKLLSGHETSYGDPRDENILFAYEYRSTDGGKTWYKMVGSRGVFTHNFDPDGQRELFGANGNKVVMSADHGATWTELTDVGAFVRDVAYDWKNKLVYAATWDQLFQYDTVSKTLMNISNRTPADQLGGRKFGSVAIDPADPNIVYAVGPQNIYNSSASVKRSLDAGQTWEVLTKNLTGSVITTGLDGGREAWGVRVHPVTRYAYVGTVCYGFWKVAPPGHAEDDYALKPIKGLAGNGQATVDWFGNGRTQLAELAAVAQHVGQQADVRKRLKYDLNGDRVIDAADIHIIGRHVFEDAAKPDDRFELYRRAAGSAAFEKLTETADTRYTDTAVTNGTTYEYRVKNLTTGSWTKTLAVTPSKKGPANLYSLRHDASIELMWDRASGTYSVYRSVSPDGPFEKLAEGLTEPVFHDTSAAMDVPYFYQVTSTGAAGESEASAQLRTMTYVPGEPPPPLSEKPVPQGYAYEADFDEGYEDYWTLAGVYFGASGLQSSWDSYTSAVYDRDLYTADYSYQADIRVGGGDPTQHAGLIFNQYDADNFYRLDVGSWNGSNTIQLKKTMYGAESTIAEAGPYNMNETTRVEVKFEAGGYITVTATKNGEHTVLFDRIHDADYIPGGKIGAWSQWSASTFDNVKVTPLTSDPGERPEPPPVPVLSGYANDFEAQSDGWRLSEIARQSGRLAATWGGETLAVYDAGQFQAPYAFRADVIRAGAAAANKASMLFNYKDARNYYRLEVLANRLTVSRIQGNTETQLLAVPHNHPEFHTIRYELAVSPSPVSGILISLYAHRDGESAVKLIDRLQDRTGWNGGKIGFATVYSGSSFDNAEVRTIEAEDLSGLETGSIAAEFWEGIGGGYTSAIPLDAAPTATLELGRLELPENRADNYGTRIRGYLHPAVGGEYTFHIAGDDESILFLSTDEDPANKSKIAFVDGWTGSREWNRMPSQTSQTVTLEAGKKVYFEVLHKEGSGGDNLAVGWTAPGMSDIAVISGYYLSPFVP